MNPPAVPYVLICAAFSFVWGSFSQASVVVSEPFNYAVNANVNGSNGGIGFAGPWAEDGLSPDYDSIRASSLNTQALEVSGNSATSRAPDALWTGLSRAITTIAGTPGTTLWVSLLVRKETAGGVAPEDYFGLVLYPTAGDGLFIGDPYENDVWTLGVAGIGEGLFPSTRAVTTGATVLLVAKITFSAGADTIRLFVNPPLGGPPGDASAAAVKADFNLSDIESIGILAGSSSADPRWSYDEIRLGTQFADVAPGLSAFQQWKVSHSLPVNAPADSDGDADGTGLFVEYCLNMNPKVPSRSGLPTFGRTSDGGGGQLLTLTYVKVRAEVTYTVKASTDLLTWSSTGVNQGTPGPPTTASIPFGSNPRIMLRLEVAGP